MAGKEGKLQCQYWPNGFIRKLWLKIKVSQMSKLTSASTHGYIPPPTVFLAAYPQHAWCFPFSYHFCLTSWLAYVYISWSCGQELPVNIVSQLTVASWLPKGTKQNVLILTEWWVKGVTSWPWWSVGLLERILQLLLFPYKESGWTWDKRWLLIWSLDKFSGLQMSCHTLA